MLAARHRTKSDDNQNELEFLFMFMEFYFVPFCSTAHVTALRGDDDRSEGAEQECALSAAFADALIEMFYFHVTANLMRLIEIVFDIQSRKTITSSDVCGALIMVCELRFWPTEQGSVLRIYDFWEVKPASARCVFMFQSSRTHNRFSTRSRTVDLRLCKW